MNDRSRAPRRAETVGPVPGAAGWLALDEDAAAAQLRLLRAERAPEGLPGGVSSDPRSP